MKAMIARRRALLGKDQKGFTLVEVIVVLVILAILMAIAVPALTGYIDKAKNSSAQVEGRSVLTALQAVHTEKGSLYGYDDYYSGFYAKKDAAGTVLTLDEYKAEVSALIGKNITGTETANLTGLSFNGGPSTVDHSVLSFTYTASTGQTVTYSGGAFTVTTP